MKALILGAGVAGATTAFLLKREGWDVTVIEREPFVGGALRTFFHAGHPYQLGPKVYYGYSEKVFKWVNSFTPIRRFPFELRTLAHEQVDEDRRFWTYPPHELDIPHYPRAEQIKKELAERDNSREPQDFDEYYRQKVGPTIYDMFTDHYSKKMWMIDDNRHFDIFKWSAKDRPIESGSREAYKGSFIGYPIAPDGYNRYFDAMLDGVEVRLNALARQGPLGFTSDLGMWVGQQFVRADVVVNTGPIDELFMSSEDVALPYAGREFHLLVLPCKQVFPGDVRFCHYASPRDEWTRVTEFKKLTYHESESTLLVLEKPCKANKLYPYLTKANEAKVKEYMAMLPPNVYSIGRLGTYRYTTIENTIAQAGACVAKITGKPNELADQFFAIGDTTMIPKDRKQAAL
jgi:UDP-galactopyranose mutase